MPTLVTCAPHEASEKKLPCDEVDESERVSALDAFTALPKLSCVWTVAMSEQPPAVMERAGVRKIRRVAVPAVVTVSVWVALLKPLAAAVSAGVPTAVSL